MQLQNVTMEQTTAEIWEPSVYTTAGSTPGAGVSTIQYSAGKNSQMI
jgi:hypothetical protein